MKLASAPAIFLAFGLLAVALVAAAEEPRDEKIFSLFTLVRISNDVCAGASKNGTCYLADECKARGGVASGECGQGYGVCCIIELSCGGKSSDNNTFLTQKSKSSFTVAERACEYRICPQADSITRIRFDLQTFVLADPGLTTALFNSTSASTAGAIVGPVIGQCLSDTFAVAGSPEICGTNTGDHLIVDSDGMNCVSAMFTIGASTSISRSWTILATQYRRGEEESSMAGPSGCLQYFTASSGAIKSFNFPTSTSTAINAAATHLANQKYTICIRKASGMCKICYNPLDEIATSTGAMTIDQGTFGLSKSGNAASKSAVDTGCTDDFLTIQDAGNSTSFATAAGNAQKFCGRWLGADANQDTSHLTICSKSVPFNVGVQFDGSELAGGTDATDDERIFPSGSIGFFLQYAQSTC